MRRILIFLGIFVLLALVAGWAAWSQLSSSPKFVIDEELAKRALQDGSGASEIQLEVPVEWFPRNLSQARALLGETELKEAQGRLEGYFAKHPESGPVRVLLAEVLRRQRNLDTALEHAVAGASALPTKGAAHWVHSRVLAMRLEKTATEGGTMGRLKAVKQVGPYRDALRTAIELDPTNLDARKEEILFYLVTPVVGDPKKGLELAQAMEGDDPIEGPLTLARALFYSGDEEAGIQKAKATTSEHPDSHEPKWVLGSLLFEQKKYDEADTYFAQITESDLKDETYYQSLYRRMRCRTRQTKGSEEVLAFVEEYFEADPQWEWSPKRHQVLCEKGRALRDLGRNGEARTALEEALSIKPQYKRARTALEGLPQ